MKIFHLTSWLSAAGGGIPPVLDAMARQMQAGNHTCSVLGLRDKSAAPGIFAGPVNPIAGAVVGPGSFGYSPELRQILRRQVNRDSVIHVHGLWMYPGLLARQLARDRGASFVISPHGMLDPWALNNSRWKKRFAAWAYENRNLRQAGCLHALCPPEEESIRSYGLKNPVCVIPNGINLPEVGNQMSEVRDQKKTLLFLGRLHPKKGLMNALRAWSKIRSQGAGDRSQKDEWQFVVAGWDQGGHKAELKKLCDELGLKYADVSATELAAGHLPSVPCHLTSDLCPLSSNLCPRPAALCPLPAALCPLPSDLRHLPSVIFAGPLFGEGKNLLLRRASAFILPSFSEGLPMAVLEAWAYGLPVLMTDQCNLPAGFAADAAIRIGTDAGSIAEGLRELFSLPTTANGQATSSLSSIGQNGRSLVERQFTWPQVAVQLTEVYEWMLGGGPKPGCVT